jgi:hypothetical protein
MMHQFLGLAPHGGGHGVRSAEQVAGFSLTGHLIQQRDRQQHIRRPLSVDHDRC